MPISTVKSVVQAEVDALPAITTTNGTSTPRSCSNSTALNTALLGVTIVSPPLTQLSNAKPRTCGAKPAEQIVESIARYCQRVSQTGHYDSTSGTDGSPVCVSGDGTNKPSPAAGRRGRDATSVAALLSVLDLT